MGLVYLIAYFMDPFIFAFHFYHLIYDEARQFQEAITFILLTNMLLKPFTGVAKVQNLVTQS